MNNRIKKVFDQSARIDVTVAPGSNRPPQLPAAILTTQQVYEEAWAQARRDWELNRLFNAWYYEI